MQSSKITICACSSRSIIDKNKVAEMAVALKNAGYEADVIPDLCRKVVQKDDDLARIGEGVILACYPRAVRSHFDWLGLGTGKIIDVRNAGTEEVLAQLDISPNITGEEHADVVLGMIACFPVETGTDAWYPVIDKERCTECGKCHDFCLFGVYTVENKRVKVVNPQNCKNNCPACARMCPNKAIMFPKYEKSPINGGTAEEETFNPEQMDRMYRERLKMRLQQRRASVSFLRDDK